jgi:hypothetical protein
MDWIRVDDLLLNPGLITQVKLTTSPGPVVEGVSEEVAGAITLSFCGGVTLVIEGERAAKLFRHLTTEHRITSIDDLGSAPGIFYLQAGHLTGPPR